MLLVVRTIKYVSDDSCCVANWEKNEADHLQRGCVLGVKATCSGSVDRL